MTKNKNPAHDALWPSDPNIIVISGTSFNISITLGDSSSINAFVQEKHGFSFLEKNQDCAWRDTEPE
jgi:hypothetical protein